MFKPTPNAWLYHPLLGLSFVAPDASISTCGFYDKMFTAIRWPSLQRIVVLASACADAEPPKGGKPRLAVDNDVRMPADVE